jgi:hypothetical protein
MIRLPKIKFNYERGRQLLLFLFCLFLAFIIWFIHRLSEEYSAVLEYRVVAVSDLPGRAGESLSEDALFIKARTSGFYILQQRYARIGNMVRLNIDGKMLKRREGVADGFYLNANGLKDKLQEYFGETMLIEGVATDTLRFFFPRKTSKNVPIAARTNLRFSKQYTLSGSVKLTPDRITIYGNYSDIQNIDTIFTQTINITDAAKSVSGVADLKSVKGVRYSVKEVYYSVPVERYVEQSVNVTVLPADEPAGKRIVLFPTEVKLIMRLPYTSKGTEKISAKVTYSQIEESLNSFVKPIFDFGDQRVLSYKTEPPYIEAKIIDK